MKAWKSKACSREAIAVAAVIAVAAGCGGGGDTSTGAGGSGTTTSTGTLGPTTSTGNPGSTTSTGNPGSTTSTGNPGSTTTTSSMASSTGAGGGASSSSTTGAGGSSGCPTPTDATVATKITMAVTWPGTLGVEMGSGTVHIWSLSTQTFNGNNITGTGRPCGSSIPDLKATILVGGMMIGNTIPDTTWETPGIPVSMITGMQTGFDVGSTVTINKNATVIGATMANPLTDPWPMSQSGLMKADHDGDTKPGITAIPKTAPGYQLPPTSAFPGAPRADRLYLATRTVFSLSGTRDTCNSVTGTVAMDNFDNHVVGCRILNGPDCQVAEYDFIDINRTIFAIGTATYKAVNLPAGATCADARAALP